VCVHVLATQEIDDLPRQEFGIRQMREMTLAFKHHGPAVGQGVIDRRDGCPDIGRTLAADEQQHRSIQARYTPAVEEVLAFGAGLPSAVETCGFECKGGC
jgi:hypothetical protein